MGFEGRGGRAASLPRVATGALRAIRGPIGWATGQSGKPPETFFPIAPAQRGALPGG